MPVTLLGGTPLAPAVALAQGKPPLDDPAVPVRITVPALGIDLPVLSSERTVPGNVRDYPLCDVAQYWNIYDLPGAPGTTWVYAHAQPGMFLPLLLNAEATSGEGLLGQMVTLQLKDGRLLRYRIVEVKQHAYNRRLALRARPSQQRLILQTSEGPPGTIPKLQVAANLIGATWTDEPPPKAQPRACWQPRPKPTDRGGKAGRTGAAKPTPQPSPATTAAGGTYRRSFPGPGWRGGAHRRHPGGDLHGQTARSRPTAAAPTIGSTTRSDAPSPEACAPRWPSTATSSLCRSGAYNHLRIPR